MFIALYGELQAIAAGYRKHERQDHTLDTRALVHEAFVRLVGDQDISWQNRKHFFVLSARAMRRILCDYARQHNARKRGGAYTRFTVSSFSGFAKPESRNEEDHAHLILTVDQALTELAAKNPTLSQLVELRYFYGMTIDELADTLEISTATVSRHWQIAKGLLQRMLS